MPNFQEVKPETLDLTTGKLFDWSGNLIQPKTSEPEISPEIKQEIDSLKTKGYSLDKISKAIDAHPDIVDKVGVKGKLQEIFGLPPAPITAPSKKFVSPKELIQQYNP